MNIIIAAPAFNADAFKQLVNQWIGPLIDAGLWVVPMVAGGVIIWQFVIWLQKPEEEREQKKFWSSVGFKIIKYAIIVELIPVIFKIFGLGEI